MTEESLPYLTPEYAKQRNRSLMERIIDRAVSDPAWKQQLLDDPEAALREANFPENQQIQLMTEEPAEVRGQGLDLYGSGDYNLPGAAQSHPRCLTEQWGCPVTTYSFGA